MRACVLTATGGIDKLQVTQVPDAPPPGPGEIRVALRAAALAVRRFREVRVYSPRRESRDAFAAQMNLLLNGGEVEQVEEEIGTTIRDET